MYTQGCSLVSIYTGKSLIIMGGSFKTKWPEPSMELMTMSQKLRSQPAADQPLNPNRYIINKGMMK